MVRKSLMDIVTLSGVRKDVLLYLDDGPRSLSEIREHLNITSPEVSPRIKELLGHNLVEFEGKKYQLTPIGKTLVKSFIPFNNTLKVFDQISDWWEEHDISSIPEASLYHIGELKNFYLIEDDINNVERTRMEMDQIINDSTSLAGICCTFNENFPNLFLNLAKRNTPTRIVITDSIFEMIKTDYIGQLREFKNICGSEIYISKDNINISEIVTDKYLFFSLCYSNGKFDLQSNLVSSDPSSIKWGYDLFEYYRLRANKFP